MFGHWNQVFCCLLLTAVCCGCTTNYNRSAEGLRYFGQARYDLAVVAFQAALNSAPEKADNYYNMAATYHQSARTSMQTGQVAAATQQYDEADKYYRLCLSRDPNHTATYRGLAALYMERQQPDIAFQLLINWTNSNPTSSDAKIELARIYHEFAHICAAQGRPDVAQACMDSTVVQLQSVLANDQNNFRAWRALGYLKEQNRDIINAIADYQRSLQANSSQKDLSDRIAALQKGAGYTAPIVNPIGTAAPTTAGATVYKPSAATFSSATSRNPF